MTTERGVRRTRSAGPWLTFTGANRHLVDWAVSLPLQPLMLIIFLQIVILILGGIISGVPLMMITLPVFMPVVLKLGYDPIWFSVLFLINAEMVQETPTHGIPLFAMKGVASPGTTIGQINRAAVPALVCEAIAMALIMLIPDLALWLPILML